MRRALILGGGGFLGSHLARNLREDGHWVTCVDLHLPTFSETAANEFIVGDLREPSFCHDVIAPRFDEIYQLAANMGGAGYIFDHRNDVDIMCDSMSINLNVLAACRRTEQSRLLFTSSACVYPRAVQLDPTSPDCAEDRAYPADPDSEYGWEKLFAERLYLAAHDAAEICASVVRLHNVFGPDCAWRGGREKAPAAICRKVAEAADGTEMEIWGDGMQTRSFLYITECVEGLRRIMASEFRGPVNLGSDEMVTIMGLAQLICSVAGKQLDIRCTSGPQGVRGRCSDNSLIHERLGWRPHLPLRVGIETTYEWIAQQVAMERLPAVSEQSG
jgi:GDP-D-mannose 3', 5'-epimerase